MDRTACLSRVDTVRGSNWGFERTRAIRSAESAAGAIPGPTACLGDHVQRETEPNQPVQLSQLTDECQAVLCRCPCGCRFHWPNDALRCEQRADTGELEEVFELSECPACGSTHRCILADPYSDADFAEPVDVVKLVAEWFARRASSPPPASCRGLRVGRECDAGEEV